MKVLVTGATGYIGGRLVPRLVALGQEVRVPARNPDGIQSRPWGEQVEIRTGDLGDPATLQGLAKGVEPAYCLVHSMEGGAGFARRDREAVGHFIQACKGGG